MFKMTEKKVEKNTQQNNNLQFSNNNVVPPQPAKVQPVKHNFFFFNFCENG